MRFHYLDSECKDLETLCNHVTRCDIEDVQKKCPKKCGKCKGKRCNKRHSIKTLAKPNTRCSPIDNTTFSSESECVDRISSKRCNKAMKNGNCKRNRIKKNCQKTCGICTGMIYISNTKCQSKI